MQATRTSYYYCILAGTTALSASLTTLEKVCQVLKEFEEIAPRSFPTGLLNADEVKQFCGEEHSDCSCPFHLNNGACYYPKMNASHAFTLSGGDIFTPITKIRPCAFRQLGTLKRLNLHYHQISEFDETVFDPLQDLEHLDIGYNWYSELPEKLFSKLTNLKVLSLTGNDPKIPEKTLVNLAPGQFDSLTSLEILYLNYQGIKEFPSGIFRNMWKLIDLDLAGNELTTIPVGLLENNLMLTAISLKENKLKTIVPGTFDRNVHLSYIDLRTNHIHDISAKVFENLPYIRQLGLNNNLCKPREPAKECYLDEIAWEPAALQTCDCILEPSKLRNYL